MTTGPVTSEVESADALVDSLRARIREGGPTRRKEELRERGHMEVRERLEQLLDPGFRIEDWILARHDDPALPADGIVTAVGMINGRKVAVMANDMSVKAGTWGTKTIYKIQRIQEVALEYGIPMIYLVDSGGARINEQYGLYLDRTHSGRIFWNMARMNGVVPQICVNFGPSPAGAAYLPAFCDLVVMIDGKTSVFLGSPRQASAATGEDVDHEQMGGARMHCKESGLGDILVETEDEALEVVKDYVAFMPDSWRETPGDIDPIDIAPGGEAIENVVPAVEGKAFDVHKVIDAVIDEGSFLEIKKLYAGELVTGFARIEGIAVGIVANQSRKLGGILMQNSSEKGAQFISTCTAYNIPLVFLMDVPGFMVSSDSEKAAIIRRGQKMLQAVAEATQPRICVVLRKGYGAGYMAMSGATFQPDCTIALPQAMLGLMGPAAAVQAIYGRKIAELPEEERPAFIAQKQEEYARDIGVWGPAAEMYIDDVIPGHELRQQIAERLRLYRRRNRKPLSERNSIIMRG